MNKVFRYKLDKSSKKFVCPNCNKKTFVLFIDTETNEYLPEQFGRCDREGKCNYFIQPTKPINTTDLQPIKHFKPKPQTKLETVFFDFETFKQTLQHYEKNTFIQNLLYEVQFPFEVNEVTNVIQLYRLGTIANGYRTSANTFPFIDAKGNIRAVQVKQFDKNNKTIGTDYLHSIIEKHHTRNNKPLPDWLIDYKKQDLKVSCLFGEHLLSKYPNNPIALVEAPKTAIYGTLYFGLPETPESLIWLAVYNKSSFSFDKLKVLEGRSVFVFPDLSKDGKTFKEWETKAKEYETKLKGTRFIFSDLLERLAAQQDKNEGNDLADYLIKLDWRSFRSQKVKEQAPPTESVASEASEAEKTNIFPQSEPLPKIETEYILKEQHENWSDNIEELEAYFLNITLPTEPIQINKGTTITNCSRFIESHFEIVNANKGNKTFLPYLERLKEFKKQLTP